MKRMLIDASHPEETRVIVTSGQKVEEFDFEAASKRPLKGNIYLAKVTRVEPSLQAAFVEYGGNRQGFLAFAEIHPDYYQIPVADRQALLAEQEAEARRRQEDDIESFEIGSGPKPDLGDDEDESDEETAGGDEDETLPLHPIEVVAADEDGGDEAALSDDEDHEDIFVNHSGIDDTHAHAAAPETDDHDHDHPETKSEAAAVALAGDYGNDSDVAAAEAAMEQEGEIEPVHGDEGDAHDGEAGSVLPAEAAEGEPGAEGAASETGEGAAPLRAPRPPQKFLRKRHYKIQEVIKRRQIILVQVVKEERGNKGAALTTYLSLPGRYCVLMPNTPRGGGISRKITNAADRKRLKQAAQGLELPEGMGLIIRTAGENRTRIEIRRDYEYLLRMWDTIRETTLNSNAPACVYEEGDLIKRAIRDLYNKDVSEIVVEGDTGYRNAKDFMRMLMPSHGKNVKPYKDVVPLFQRYQVEAQLDAMFSPTVTLKSGGYIVINQTEALVSIDVNSGRATREHSIEETARKTNLEAADEIGRQLRLRDLAGLIVIDFIDMEDGRNDREVEKRLRDAVKNDRARVQIGKISQFGLMEMSRQRLRAGVVAGSTITCPHCSGTGLVRSVESASLRVVRGLEEEGQKYRSTQVVVRVAADVALYTLNHKRHELARIETDYGMTVSFEPQDGMPAGEFEIERVKQRDPADRPARPPSLEAGFVHASDPEDDNIPDEPEEEDEETIVADTASGEDDEDAPREARAGGAERGDGNKRRRRRGGRGRNRERGEQTPRDPQAQDAAPSAVVDAHANADADADETEAHEAPAAGENGGENEVNADGRRRRRRRRGRRGGRDRDQTANGESAAPAETAPPGAAPRAPAPAARAESVLFDRFGAVQDEIDTTPQPLRPGAASSPVWSLSEDKPGQSGEPPKKGWWQRTFSGDK